MNPSKEMRLTTLLTTLLATLITMGVTGCAPKVYVVDRTTLLEEEAGGTWPDLEAQWKRSQVKNAPSSDLHSEASARQKRLTRVLEPDAAPLNEENKGSKR